MHLIMANRAKYDSDDDNDDDDDYVDDGDEDSDDESGANDADTLRRDNIAALKRLKTSRLRTTNFKDKHDLGIHGIELKRRNKRKDGRRINKIMGFVAAGSDQENKNKMMELLNSISDSNTREAEGMCDQLAVYKIQAEKFDLMLERNDMKMAYMRGRTLTNMQPDHVVTVSYRQKIMDINDRIKKKKDRITSLAQSHGLTYGWYH